MKKLNKTVTNHFFYVSGFLLLAFIVIWALMSPPVTSAADKSEFVHLHQGWSQIIGDKTIPLDDIQNFKKVEVGKPLTFVCTLPEIQDGDVILFYSEDQEVTCSIDDVIVHSFLMDENYKILKSPGSAWNQIDLDQNMSGKKITLSFFSPVKSFNNKLNTIYLIENINVDSLRVNYLAINVLVSFALLVAVLISLYNARLWKNSRRKKYFFAIAQFYAFILVILLARIGFFELFFARPILSFLLEHLFIRFLPVALWRLAVNSTDRFRYPFFVKSLKILAFLDITISFGLQFIFGISFLETMWINNVIVIAMMLSMMINIVMKFLIFKKLSPEEYPSLVLGLVFLGGIGDMTMCFVFNNPFFFRGICSVTMNILYLILVYTFFIKQDAKLAQEKKELELSLVKLKNESLLKQINVHFIFNTLNGISALCKADPKKADDAIVTFSKYLRTYIKYIGTEEKVDIVDELELVENYLLIEQMRFGDSVSFEINVEFEDFEIPPFTIQTLVENAVIHGILKKEDKGIISISTIKKGDYAQVIIQDNGAGFDTNANISSNSFGLKNVNERIRLISGGTISTESKIGVGTKITITVPINKDSLYE